ncbi:MAG: TonB family protein, partial [Bacteroidales bacterium]|nr:TonB family protein [Bacteroidales bacterium]
NGNKVRAIISADYGKFVTGIIDCSKPINTLVIKEGEEQPQLATVATPDLVYVINGERMPEGFDLNTIDPNTISSMEVLKTEKALKEYGTDKGVIVITTEPSKADEKKAVPDVYIDGKKATSEDIAALPANPKGSVAADGTVWITTEDEPKEKQQNCSPSFNGGTNADFQKWVQENIRYPEGATSEGRVSVSFTVSETGKIEDVKALSGSDRKLNDEAVRVISSSPDWAPATKDGKPVAIRMIIPVEFNK